MTVADRIKQRRQELQLSQSELAERAGYSDKTRISKIENSGNEVSMKQVKKIAKALNVSSAYLMGWETLSGEKTLNKLLIEASLEEEDQMQRAKDFIEKYDKANPQVQAAIKSLLGLNQ